MAQVPATCKDQSAAAMAHSPRIWIGLSAGVSLPQGDKVTNRQKRQRPYRHRPHHRRRVVQAGGGGRRERRLRAIANGDQHIAQKAVTTQTAHWRAETGESIVLKAAKSAKSGREAGAGR